MFWLFVPEVYGGSLKVLNETQHTSYTALVIYKGKCYTTKEVHIYEGVDY